MLINHRLKPNKTKTQALKGFSLIEVLVALFLFATGILGIASLQLKSLSMLSNADSISAAMIGLSDMADRMRADPQTIDGDGFDAISIPNDTKPSCTSCSSTGDVALVEAYAVYEQLQRFLAEPTLDITDVGDDLFTIQVTWLERVGVLSETKSHRVSLRI